jgi:hypothetical protein
MSRRRSVKQKLVNPVKDVADNAGNHGIEGFQKMRQTISLDH